MGDVEAGGLGNVFKPGNWSRGLGILSVAGDAKQGNQRERRERNGKDELQGAGFCLKGVSQSEITLSWGARLVH